jgi:hypothetical protein
MTALPSDSAISVGLSEEQQAAQQSETSIDVDNGVSMSVGTASTLLASSVGDYVFENSCRYHKFREGSYKFLSGESERWLRQVHISQEYGKLILLTDYFGVLNNVQWPVQRH